MVDTRLRDDEGGERLISEWMTWIELLPLLQKSDLVQFKRTAKISGRQRGIYSHWAMYIGDDRSKGPNCVIHISTEEGDVELLSAARRATEGGQRMRWNDSMPTLTKIKNGSTAEVRIDPLVHVAGQDLVRINNSCDRDIRPFPASIALERARTKLTEGGYCVIRNNCEHYVKWCRYGNSISEQATAAKSVVLASAVAIFNPVLGLGLGATYFLGHNVASKQLNRLFGSNYNLF